MHVALNAAWLDPGASGGPETYLRGLVPALAARFPDLQLTVLTTRRGARALAADGWDDFCRIVRLPADEGRRHERLVAEVVLVPGAARRLRADVLHSTASLGPPWTPGLAHVVTVHDVTFLRVRTFSRATTVAMRVLLTGAVRDADALLAPSAATRDEIAIQLGVASDRFAVAYLGAGRLPAIAPADASGLRRRLGVPEGGRVVLCVGALRPHKNQRVLVEALPRLDDDVVLVLAGHGEPYEDELRRRVAELGLERRVCVPGYLDDADLEGVWAIAAAAAHPSVGEGFGFPVLEALQRGVPVACSDIPVLREVGGDVPRYFDPQSADGAARALRTVLADADPDRVARGRAHAATFTWERCAEATYAAYERAL